jgi:hypothetical protein
LPLKIVVQIASLLTASENDVHFTASFNDVNPIPLIAAPTSQSSASAITDPSSVNGSTASYATSASSLPSPVLGDAFHIIHTIDVTLRHGMSKDFKRSFKDAMFIIDAEDRKNVEEYLIKNVDDWNTCIAILDLF